MSEEERQDSTNLQVFITERGCLLESAETCYATDIFEHPQINHVIYHPDNSHYEMWDIEGNYFCFQALNYNEETNKELEPQVKKLYKRRSFY